MSEKELLEKMSQFPKHELSTTKRSEMLQEIKAKAQQTQKKGWNIQYQRAAAIAAMLTLFVIAPLLYFSNGVKENTPGAGTSGENVKEPVKAESGVHFALVDEAGTPHYEDSNFGIPNRVSLLAPKEWIREDYRSVSKIMVFLWGDDIDTYKILNIEATHIETGVKENIDNTSIAMGMYGADAHAVTSLPPFQFHGAYNLNFILDGKSVGEFSIHVKEPYIRIGKSTILLSQEDLLAGTYEDIAIEVEGTDLPQQIELKIVDKIDQKETVFTFGNKSDYTLTDGSKVSMYTGNFTVNHSGKYQFYLLDQLSDVEVRMPIN